MRACDECRACCTTLAIHDLDKPSHVACKYEFAYGCGIYDDGRPQVCVDFECAWLESPTKFRNMERPDRSGLIVARAHPKESLSQTLRFAPMLAHEVWARAATGVVAQRMLQRIGRTVLVCVRPTGDPQGRQDHPVYGPEPARSRALKLMRQAVAR